MLNRFLSIFLLCTPVVAFAQGDLSTAQQWQTVTLSFDGPETSEAATENPFTDYRLLVTFKHGDSQTTVRGFYSADGNAAESSADAGSVWQVRFSPDQVGEWTYEATFAAGPDIAISDETNAGSPVPLKQPRGSFAVAESKHTQMRGRLIADAGYLQFAHSQERWLKAGSDSPENLLAYVDFDGTWRMSTEASQGEATPSKDLHRYAAHISDWKPGDATWQNGKGKGLIGGLNYLSSMGMNAVYFLTLNINGDGKDVWPYASPEDFTRFDCSKLDQWEIVFEHMQQRGILLHVVTQETENERLLDDGDTGRLRKLYYRELIARFAHHPLLIWNLGEENGPADFSPNGQTSKQQRAMATYLKQSDPYKHPVLIHTHSTPDGKDEILPALLGHQPLDGLSFQVDKRETVNTAINEWRSRAKTSGRPWLIGMDEIGFWHTGVVPDTDDPNHDELRRHALWGSLMAGAYGVEWYFGAKFPHNDLTSEDWRQRNNMWQQTHYAHEFFTKHLPYWEMEPANDLINRSEAYGFAKKGAVYAFYLSKGSISKDSELKVELDGEHDYHVSWYDPENGGELRKSETKVRGRAASPSFDFSSDTNQDWVLLIQRAVTSE